MMKETYGRTRLLGGLQFQRVRIHTHHARVNGDSLAGIVLEQQVTGNAMSFWNLKACPTVTALIQPAISPHSAQTVLLIKDQSI